MALAARLKACPDTNQTFTSGCQVIAVGTNAEGRATRLDSTTL
jgi:hypothetical protein